MRIDKLDIAELKMIKKLKVKIWFSNGKQKKSVFQNSCK